MYLNWLIKIPFVIIMWVVAIILAPILPIFAKDQYGKINNNNGTGVEPRLPNWLSWFQTPDNSLLGDDNFKSKHSGTYLDKVMWLWRNPIYGLLWTTLAKYIEDPSLITKEGDTTIKARENAKAGWYKLTCPEAFEYTCIIQLFKFKACLQLRGGWILGNAEKGKPCLYLMTFRFMEFIPD